MIFKMISKALYHGCSWSRLVSFRMTTRVMTSPTKPKCNSPSSAHFHTVNYFCSSAVSRFKRSDMYSHSNLILQQRLQAHQSCPRSSSTLSNNNHETDDKKDGPGSWSAGPRVRRDRLEWQESFRDLVASKDPSNWLASDWEYVAKEMVPPKGPRWEVLCMHTLYQDKELSLGQNLIMYLQQSGEPVSNTVLTFYIGLLGETSESAEQDEETKRLFDQLLADTGVFDPASIKVLTSALSNTKYYSECMNLVKMCQETSIAGPDIVQDLIMASLRYKDVTLCQSALTMLEETNDPSQITHNISKMIETCLAVKNEEGLSLVMHFFQKHGLLIPATAIDEITESFESHHPNKWNIQTGYIHHRSGQCVKCQYQMEKNEMSRADFETLQKAFLEQVIVGTNIFYKSTPEEVNHFVDYVQRNGPFDVVIDGLNVFHKQRPPKKPIVLYKAVKYFQDQNQKVLLLGSKALMQHNSTIQRLDKKPAMYLTSTTKADDVFFLYAALQSGKDTLIVSKDKLRDHKYLLDPKLRHLFQQWLKTAQIYDWFFSRYGDFTIGKRFLYSIGPHKDEGGLHLPINDIDKDAPFGNFQVLCLRDTTVDSFKIPKKDHQIVHQDIIFDRKKNSKIGKKLNSVNYGKKKKRKQSHIKLELDEFL